MTEASRLPGDVKFGTKFAGGKRAVASQDVFFHSDWSVASERASVTEIGSITRHLIDRWMGDSDMTRIFLLKMTKEK